jgi:excinuclease ABC subunit C
MTRSCFERHSSNVWRKTAQTLIESATTGTHSEEEKVNVNGAPLLGDTRDLFRPKTSDIPSQPGVYKWRDGDGRVIYVGKAKNLRNRLSNYFQPLTNLHPRTQTMVLTARSLEWTVVGTELESLTLEYTWIKEFDPRFNVVFRDDKTYPYLAVSVGEKVPRVWMTRIRKRRDTRYFGPYAKVWDVRRTLDALLKTYPVRTCTPGVFRKAQMSGRPCLLASLGKCSAPCVGNISVEAHRKLVAELVGVMTGRLGKSYKSALKKQMIEASEKLNFEKAARLRDQIAMLETVIEQNSVVFNSDVDVDVFGMASDELEASVHAFFVRSGAIRGERSWSVERVEDITDEELMGDLIIQVYSDLVSEHQLEENSGFSASDTSYPETASIEVNQKRDALGVTQRITALNASDRAKATKARNSRQDKTGRADLLEPISPVPKELVVPVKPDKIDELETWLSGIRSGAVTIRVATRGEKKALMDRANDNAQQSLQRSKMNRIADLGARTEAMNDVAKALMLKQSPLRIECYDISNTVAGAYQVASMVVFEDAMPKKSEYRRFAIKGENGSGALDDTSALYETLTRRFKHGNIAGDSGESIENERNVHKALQARSNLMDPSLKNTHNPGEMETANIVQQNTQPRHFAYKPNLIVVDGGKPQVEAAARALADVGVHDVALCGLAKRLEEVWVPGEDYPIIFKRQSQGMYLLQRVRDESHRFAITYHRQARRKGSLRSVLYEIPGIGPTYQKLLLKEFGSVRQMRKASLESLEAVPGIGVKKAESIYQVLHAGENN